MDIIESYVSLGKMEVQEIEMNKPRKKQEQVAMDSRTLGSSPKPLPPLRTYVPNSNSLRPDLVRQDTISRPPSPRLRRGRSAAALPATPSVQPDTPIQNASRPPSTRPPSTLRAGSRASSLYPKGDFRNADEDTITDIKCDIMVKFLHQQQVQQMWTSMTPNEGVMLKKTRANYTCSPESLHREVGGFFDMITAMNVRCAMTVNTRIVKLILNEYKGDLVPLPHGQMLQVLPSIQDLPRCRKHHFGAFIANAQILVVWDDDPQTILARAANFEEALVQLMWKFGFEDEPPSDGKYPSVSTGDGTTIVNPEELEEALVIESRPTILLNPILVGLTIALLIGALGLGWRNLAQEIAVDGDLTRLALVVVTPAQIFVSLFFMQIVVVNVMQMIGPISQLNINSKFYSGEAPHRLNRDRVALPHITIQMPVYKEGLIGVIQPTILSLKKAISTYELQGGTANVFVNDDGMQIIDEAEGQARREFYEEHNIGWVARPKENLKPQSGENVFRRRGKFKKASNMNYALMVSNRVEDKLAKVERHKDWTTEEESKAYEKCLCQVIEEEEGRAWAEGNVRIGDYILLIDSDTRVPSDCLVDAASEMEQCPNVGILQFSSGVMQVTDTFFENGITFFTNLIYSAIRYTVANGDVSPFVGHNAILRWSALQEVSYTDNDGYEKFWSESHVSEDFDMSLRLQIHGYVIRLAAYTGDGFKEGVSLTVYDELSRWEKYAYGCNELLFHPFRQWFYKGPFTPLFRKFLFSNLRITSKITILAYIGTYYAIGAAWILTVANYFLIGWFNGHLDHYYLDSFKVYFSLIIVFSCMGNLALAILRYRLNEKSILGALWENFQWLLLLSLFLGGISLHVSQALLCHFFEIDMTWGATAKEVEETNFFQEMPKLIKRFRGTFVFCALCTGLMIVGATAFPVFWQITDFVALFPLCTVVVSHFMLPIALNPALMMFTW